MGDWKSVLKADPTEWLLGKDNPSVRYLALTDLLENSENDRVVEESKRAISRVGVVPKILAKQKRGGYWGVPENFYVKGKYRGTVWQLIVLAELGADVEQQQIGKACEFILDSSQDRESGGFSYMSAADGSGAHGKVLPCLTGNMVWSLIRLGYLKDARVQKGIDWIVRYQRFDDGAGVSRGWPYEKHKDCWGRHSCHMGVVKALKALAEIPAGERSKQVSRKIEEGAEYILEHHVHKKSHDLTLVSKQEWLQFGFPLMWNTDVLEILGILTKLGYRDERMQEAVDLVVSKQDDLGRWKMERSFNGRFQVNIELKGKPSRWITLNALRVLKRFYAV